MGGILRLPPRGHYLAHEVGRLAGVSGDQIGQWARRGYIRSSQSSGRPRVYSYQDAGEALLVHELVLLDIARVSIRRTIERLRMEFGTDWPLQSAELFAHENVPEARGQQRMVVHAGRDVPTDQPVITQQDMVQIRGHLARGGWAARELPNLQHIEVDPDRVSGTPAIRGTRVPAEDVARLAKAPEGMAILLDEYGLTTAQVDDARQWWARVTEYERREVAA